MTYLFWMLTGGSLPWETAPLVDIRSYKGEDYHAAAKAHAQRLANAAGFDVRFAPMGADGGSYVHPQKE